MVTTVAQEECLHEARKVAPITHPVIGLVGVVDSS